MRDALDLDALDRLEREATPGPWENRSGDLAVVNDQYVMDEYGLDADLTLTAAARNALPALLVAARERDEAVELLRDALTAIHDLASGAREASVHPGRRCNPIHDFLHRLEAEQTS